MTEPTRAEAVAAAFDKVESGGTGNTPEPQTPPQDPSTQTPPAGEPPAGSPPVGDTKPAEGAAPTDASGAPQAPKAAPANGKTPPDAPKPPADASQGGLKAPAAWKPDVREHWNGLPDPVKQEIARRETAISKYVQSTARVQQFQDQFEAICSPYQNLIAMDGGDTLKTFQSYLQTAATLRLGSQTEKAEALARAITQFNVDVSALDAVLTSMLNGGQRHRQPQQPQQFRDPRLDTLLNDMEATRAQQQQRMDQENSRLIETFAADPKNEFFRDLQPIMADLMDVAANNGISMTLADAYQRASLIHPDVSKIVATRNAQNAVQNQQQHLAGKRNAVIQTPGAPNIAPKPNSNATIRDAIEAAVDFHSR